MSKAVFANQLKVAALSLAIVLMAAATWNQFARLVSAMTPTEAWMQVIRLHVPDHRQGEDPMYSFERVVHLRSGVNGQWTAEIYDDDGAQACPTRRGPARYEVGENTTFRAPLSAYLGECRLVPGEYIVVVTNKITDGLTRKTLRYSSNQFTVRGD